MLSFHLEHESLQWFCWYIKAHEEPNQTYFFQLLFQRFGPSAFNEFTRSLTKLHQTSIERVCQIKFENLANHTEGFTDAFYRSCFISGLKNAIRSEVQMFCPNIMMETLGWLSWRRTRSYLNSAPNPLLLHSKILFLKGLHSCQLVEPILSSICLKPKMRALR